MKWIDVPVGRPTINLTITCFPGHSVFGLRDFKIVEAFDRVEAICDEIIIVHYAVSSAWRHQQIGLHHRAIFYAPGAAANMVDADEKNILVARFSENSNPDVIPEMFSEMVFWQMLNLCSFIG